jgi:hypothetical protein
MQHKIGEFVVMLSAGTIGYSWVADATAVSTFMASLVGIFTAGLGAWFYYERAMNMRLERKRKHGKKDSRERDSLSE